MKRLLLVLTAVVALAATSCGTTGSTGGSAAAAVVDGTTITMDQLDAEMSGTVEAAYGSYDEMDEQARESIYGASEGSYSMEFTAGVLQNLIVFQLIEDEAAAQGVTPSAQDSQAAEQAIEQQSAQWTGEMSDEFRAEQVRRAALVSALNSALQAQAGPTEVADEDVRAYYDANIDTIVEQSGEFACVSHILIGWTEQPDPDAEIAAPTDEQKADALTRAQSVQAELAAGGDFAALAEQYSVDPGSQPEGGSLGCVPQGSGFVQPFEDAVFGQTVGEVGEPVETEFGYHIILVRSRGVPPFEGLEPSIRAFLEQEAAASSSPLQGWLQDKMGEVEITVSSQLGTWTDAGLVPPEGASTQTTVGSDADLTAELPVDLGELTTQPGG